MPSQAPQHPANQQQGLGAPTGNQYYTPNQALSNAQAQQAQAGAVKAQTEAAILQQGGLGNPVQAGPTIQPQEIQARQMADALLNGQLDQVGMQQAIQSGQLDPAVAEAAMRMAQQQAAQAEAQYNQQQGLEGF